MALPPGDYVLENVSAFGAAERKALAALETPAYHARLATEKIFGWKMDDVPRQWGDRMPFTFNVSAIGVTNVVVTVQSASGSETRAFPVKLCAKPDDWEFFNVEAALKGRYTWAPNVRKYRGADPAGGAALGFAAKEGAFAGPKDFVGQRVPCDAVGFQNLFGETGRGKTAVFRARATDAFTKRVEVVFVQADGGNWGVDLELTPEWRTIRVPVKDFRPYWTTRRGDGTEPDMGQAQVISLGYGRWLYGDTLDKPHGYEISSIKVEF